MSNISKVEEFLKYHIDREKWDFVVLEELHALRYAVSSQQTELLSLLDQMIYDVENTFIDKGICIQCGATFGRNPKCSCGWDYSE